MIEYAGVEGVGEWFGVSGAVVRKWRTRYTDTSPCPEPDAMTDGRTPGWLPKREAEWRAWHKSRPGRGKGGGRPPKMSG